LLLRFYDFDRGGVMSDLYLLSDRADLEACKLLVPTEARASFEAGWRHAVLERNGLRAEAFERHVRDRHRKFWRNVVFTAAVMLAFGAMVLAVLP
jgi:hypothetical protein